MVENNTESHTRCASRGLFTREPIGANPLMKNGRGERLSISWKFLYLIIYTIVQGISMSALL